MNTSPLRCPLEKLAEDEPNQIAKLDEITKKLLDKRYPDGTTMLRGVHPKAHGCVEASFTVNPELDEELKVGLFAYCGESYKAVIRFSNAAARVLPDIVNGEHGSRGMAIKIFDIKGNVLVKDNGMNNQDFLMINQPVFAFANTEDYLRLNEILLADNDRPDRFFKDMPQIMQKVAQSKQLTEEESRTLDSFEIIQGIKSTPEEEDANPLEMQYFSAAPFLFGKNKVMKYSAQPVIDSVKTEFPDDPGPDYLREALNTSMQKNQPREFKFLLQVAGSETECNSDLGIENASSEWDKEKYPFIEVARIMIAAPQENMLSDAQRAHCEELQYNPWHSLKEHQPLGSINRLRKSVYLTSAKHRSERAG